MAVNGHRFRAEKDKGRWGVGWGETLLLRSQALLLSTLCDLEVITPAVPNETHLEGCAQGIWTICTKHSGNQGVTPQ